MFALISQVFNNSIPTWQFQAHPGILHSEVKAGCSQVEGHSQLHREFKDSLEYMVPCLKILNITSSPDTLHFHDQ